MTVAAEAGFIPKFSLILNGQGLLLYEPSPCSSHSYAKIMRNQSLKNQPMSDLFSELANAGRPLFPGSDVDDQVLVEPETKFGCYYYLFS